jgi:membrane-bound serine protease (ClpP class)
VGSGGTRTARHRAAVLVLASLLAGAALLLLAPAAAETQVIRAQDATTSVLRTSVTGPITPVTADHLSESLERAARDGHAALVVQLDTPGGLLTSTRDIVQDLLDAPIPVIVHVAPPGADAGSAGTFITMAAHIAAMSPATTIGAATPVSLEGQEVDGKIVENTVAFAEAIAEARGRDEGFAIDAVREGRSVTATTALELGAIDLIATETAELLSAVDGTEVDVRSGAVTLTVAGAAIVDHELSGTQRLLQLLADPNLAFIFLSLGTLAILYEIANPGVGLGGAIGVTSLVLAMFSLSVLPTNVAGIALLLLAAGLFIAELFIPGIGAGAGGGTAALLLAGVFLFRGDTGIAVSWWVIIPTVAVMFGTSVAVGIFAARSRKVRPVKGSDDLIGRTTVVRDAGSGRPRAQLYGSFWWVSPADDAVQLRDGDRVRVVARDNLELTVEVVARAEDPADAPEHGSRPAPNT